MDHGVGAFAGPTGVGRRHSAPVDHLLPCVGDAEGRGAVAGEQQCVALLLELGYDVVDYVAVGVGKGGGEVGTSLDLVANHQIIALAICIDALRQGVHAAVGTACRKGSVGERVDGLHGVGQSVVDVLHRTDIHICVLPHVVGTAAGADAFGCPEGVVALFFVMIARLDGQSEGSG